MPDTIYELDPDHTYAGFCVRHMMVTQQRGQFRRVGGALTLNRSDISKSRVQATIEVASVDTGVPRRDDHLRSADFFDSAIHPNIDFVSTEIRCQPDGRLHVVGDLTIRGVTRPVLLVANPVSNESTDPFGRIKVGTAATATISRKEFGLVWNAVLETGGVAVGDDVEIVLDLQFQREGRPA